MNVNINSELWLRKNVDGYSANVSDDQSLVCLWKSSFGIEIYRTDGGYLINKVNDATQENELIDVMWRGNTLYCCYANGKVRIYKEGREQLKELTFTPKGVKTKCMLCDNLELEDDRFSLSDGNLLKSMPKLNKWDLVKNELAAELIISNDLEKNKNVDIFMAVDSKTNKLILSIEGTLNIKVGEKLKLPKDITRIIKVSPGKYMLLGKDYTYQILDLSFLLDHNIYKLIKTTQEYNFLLRYLKQLHRHMGMKLADPYFRFVGTLLSAEHKNGLEELFYTGVTNLELMEELYDVQLQKFRLDKWNSLSDDLCSKSIGLMVACVTPLLERMIVLGATIEALCEAITWIKFPNEMAFDSKLRPLTVDLLKSVRSQTEDMKKIKRSQRLGLNWVQSLSDRLSKMRQTRDRAASSDPLAISTDRNLSSNGNGTVSAFEDYATIQKRTEIASVETFLTKNILPKDEYEWVRSTFPNLILRTQAEFDKIMKEYTLKWFKRQIKTGYNQTRDIQTEDNGDTICDIQILHPANTVNHALLVTTTELVLVNLQTHLIDARASLPLPSRKVASTLTSQSNSEDSSSSQKKKFKPPRFQLVPISAVKTSLSISSTHNAKDDTFYLLPLCLTVSVITEATTTNDSQSNTQPNSEAQPDNEDPSTQGAVPKKESRAADRFFIRIA
ncbi:unnamed protein product [Kluyveromyces dobzhanskii CBS 2104]|uniref:WGS project CCBQ000000000 data, contig 00058 n=1 Tax=Kluyveromyces dobzhanskii CBS 2104 TaxID=1427455 RepID=A0A0A8LDG4_9SACH|nr:unnamed protein product [Kluyveromyces dobzhanskii CBS 2104]